MFHSQQRTTESPTAGGSQRNQAQAQQLNHVVMFNEVEPCASIMSLLPSSPTSSPPIARARALAKSCAACLHADWYEAREMIEGMLAEPQWLRGNQEDQLREFFELTKFH